MNRTLVWGITIVVVLGAAVLAGRASQAPTINAGPPLVVDPALARCRDLGEAATDDLACQAAWAAERRRFFGGPGS